MPNVNKSESRVATERAIEQIKKLLSTGVGAMLAEPGPDEDEDEDEDEEE